MMKKSNFYSYILIFFLSACLPNAYAADFFLTDSDGDEYGVGEFLGYEMGHQKYYVRYYNGPSFRPDAEGFLYYNDFQESMKMVLFENDNYYGFTLEGHWIGSGSSVSYINTQHDLGRMRLYIRGRSSSSQSKAKTPRVKHVRKG